VQELLDVLGQADGVVKIARVLDFVLLRLEERLEGVVHNDPGLLLKVLVLGGPAERLVDLLGGAQSEGRSVPGVVRPDPRQSLHRLLDTHSLAFDVLHIQPAGRDQVVLPARQSPRGTVLG
jgi:hypothetical protein